MRVVDVVYINKEKINILSQSTEYFPQNLRNNQDGIFSNVKQVISQSSVLALEGSYFSFRAR